MKIKTSEQKIPYAKYKKIKKKYLQITLTKNTIQNMKI